MNNSGTHGRTCATAGQSLLWALVTALVFSGCSSASYRRSADKEVYGIIQKVEKQVTGQTNAFTIDTPYSARKPAEILPAELIEDRLQTNQRVLTIEEALDLAVKNSREYQDRKEALYTKALDLWRTRYEVGGRITPSSVTTAGGSRTSSGQRSADVTTETGVVISQLFRTGGRLTVDMLNSVMLYYSGKPELAFSRIKVDLVQPLLRGFGRNNADVEKLTQAERKMVYAVRDFSLYQDEFALGVVNNYFALLQQKDVIRNNYTNYLGRVQSTRRLEARANDRERLTDVDQTRQAELKAKNEYVNEVARYQTLLDNFKITLGIPVGEKLYLDDQALNEVKQTGLIPAPLDTDAAYRLATQRQLKMLNSIDEFEDSKRTIQIAADELKPGLDLFAKASLKSEGTDYTRFDPDKVAVTGDSGAPGVGLQLDLPLNRVPLARIYRAAWISFESSLRTFTKRLDDLKKNIESRVRTLDQNRQNYEIQKNALELANRRVESTTLLQQAGRAEVRDLVDAQNEQLAAQNAVTKALVDYQSTRLQLMLDIGALDSEPSKFWLKDHLAAFLPGGTPVAVQPESAEQEVRPPERYFNN